MIPPVEEREVRPCEDCIFRIVSTDGYYQSGYQCLSVYLFDDYWDGIRPFKRCNNHFTSDEMLELINQHNDTEKKPRERRA